MDSRERLDALMQILGNPGRIVPLLSEIETPESWMARAILASDWLRDTLAAERRAEEAAVATMAREWRDENRAAVQDGDTSLAAEKLRAAAIEMNAFAKAVERGEHRAIRNLEPEA